MENENAFDAERLFNKCRVDFSLAHFFAQLILSDDERKRVKTTKKKKVFYDNFKLHVILLSSEGLYDNDKCLLHATPSFRMNFPSL